MARTDEKRYLPVMQAALLVAAILLAYSKVFKAGFISWDDAEYVVNNKDVHAFSVAHIRNWFTSFYIGNYHPLTMVSYAIDFAIGKQSPFIYHLTNIVLHIANTLLLYAFVNRIQQNKWVSFFIALLFAIHPVQTESVSWIAERKNVLYGFFFLLSLWLYAGYVAREKKRWLLWVLLAGIAAMLSKATAVALPLSLMAIDVWLHRSLREKKVWLEKVPFFIIALITGIIALQAQQEASFLNLHPDYSVYHRVLFGGYAYVQYMVQLLFPVKLSVIYPYPGAIGIVHFLYLLMAIAIITLGIVAYRRKWYTLCGGILFYTVNIALVLQFVQFGEVLMADRYLYIASIGIWLPAVHYLFVWVNKRKPEILAIATVSGVAIVLLCLTYTRNTIWLSELQFWEAVVEIFPQSSVAQNSVGGVYLMRGQYTEAIQYIDEAIALDANNYKAWYNKGVLHLRKGELNEGATALDRCLALQEYPKALFSRALLYQQAGQPLRALQDVEKVLQMEPANARAHFIKGNCMEQTGNYETAITAYNKAVEYGDSEPIFYLRRGIVKMQTGDQVSAIQDFGLIIATKPGYGEAWYLRGIAKQQNGQMPCHDLNQARNLGYKEAEAALRKYCNND